MRWPEGVHRTWRLRVRSRPCRACLPITRKT
jgi:hypothetical protein